jgi:hypothetical protein
LRRWWDASAAIAILVLGGAGSAGAQSDAPASSTEEFHAMPQDGVFSSITQNLRGTEGEVVRGHFEVGEPPNVHRYYCLVNPKTGRREPNGVVGDPVTGADGMTRINGHEVSMYTCARAEQKGYLVTAGYVVPPNVAKAASAAPAAASTSAPAAAASATPTPGPASTPAPTVGVAAAPAAATPPVPRSAVAAAPAPLPPEVSQDKIDVAGVKLGMSPDEVRAVLKSKRLRNFKEWTETLSYPDQAGSQPLANGKFVNVIAAWTPPAAAADDSFTTEGDAFEVMFTPVPGRERALAIVHSQGFTAANAIHETVLDAGLLKKYGGYVSAADLPDAVTWRFQQDGSLQVGDACRGRGTFGGLGGLDVSSAPRQNVALRRTPDDLRAQIDRCGGGIVTADHYTVNGGALPADRLVTRFTVTAYSPALALEGANTAARLIQAAGRAKVPAPAVKDAKAPDL